MPLRVMTWNIAGAKLLAHLDGPPHHVAATYTMRYNESWQMSVLPYFRAGQPAQIYPDVILLQECIGFENTSPQPSIRWQSGASILQDIFEGYKCFFFPALTSHGNPHPHRWRQFREGGNYEHHIPDYINVQQGYGICVRNESCLRRLWVDEEATVGAAASDDPAGNYHLCFEAVPTRTGMYLGGRDTEQRLAVMGRLLIGEGDDEQRYLNFINIHLATLKGERAGNIRINRLASAIRLRQLDTILDDVVSAYQEAIAHRVPRALGRRKEDVWIVAGDFNSTRGSEELMFMKRVGFVDGNPNKEIVDLARPSLYDGVVGTKWSLDDPGRRSVAPLLPPATLDYIFCGLERTSFSTGCLDVSGSKRPLRPFFLDKRFETDHAVVFASFEL